MMNTSKFFLFIVVFLYYSELTMSQNVRMYVDIDPTWHEKSLNYWNEAKGYGKNIPAQIKEEIISNHKDVNSKISLLLQETFHEHSINFNLAPNPTELYLNEGEILH